MLGEVNDLVEERSDRRMGSFIIVVVFRVAL